MYLVGWCYSYTGEVVVGPRKTLFMDEISTGLDSSTTYQIVKCTRNFVHQMKATVLMALLQPAPETFELFDDLVLLSEGYIVYQGPRAEVLEFFESLGFGLPPRKGVADFLQEVSNLLKRKFIFSIFRGSYLTWYIPRSHLERTKLSTGLILRNHTRFFLFQKLQKPLKVPDLEGLWCPLSLFHMINLRVILRLCPRRNLLYQNLGFLKLVFDENSC